MRVRRLRPVRRACRVRCVRHVRRACRVRHACRLRVLRRSPGLFGKFARLAASPNQSERLAASGR
eukprot:4355551-Alexandrium_andersonii.AAC.1